MITSSEARKNMVGLICIVLLSTNGRAAGDDNSDRLGSQARLPTAAQELLRIYPGLRCETVGSAVRSFHSLPSTAAETAVEAAHVFWLEHGGAFGIDCLDLRQLWSTEVSFGRFTAFAYCQFMEGLPVESSAARLVVRSGDPQRVVLVTGVFAQPPPSGFAPMMIDGEQAIGQVQAMPEYAGWMIWSAPELVVYAGTGEQLSSGLNTFGPPVRAWRFSGDNGDFANRAKLTFFVDAATGALVGIRNEIIHTDVVGTVQGMGSPGTRPDSDANPPAALNIADMRMNITGGNNGISDRSGGFAIANGGTVPVTLTSNVSSGLWVNVNTQSGSEIGVSQIVTPPGPAELIYNDTPTEANTAQVNTFLCTTAVHNFVTDRTSWNRLDLQIPANVNLAQTCNAFFDGNSINFFAAGGGCPNTAYSTIVSHEYGHFIVNRLNLAQGAFGEGFGDSIAMLQYDDPIVGREFFGSTPLRDFSSGIPEDPYPCPGSCNGEVHCCGETLGGFWWDVREQIGSAMGEPAGIEYARQLFVDWLQITAGGQGNNSAHPLTVVEILTMDDDDGNLLNGSPNFTRICSAATAHSLPCPARDPVEFQFPDGIPTLLAPDQSNGIRVDVVGVAADPVPGTGTVSYSVDGGSFATIPMEQGNPNEYTARIPAFPCDGRVRFYFTALSSTGSFSFPVDAPATTISATVATQLVTVFQDAFESNLGWTVDPADTATAGRWSREDPQSTSAQPGDDHTPAPGTLCWVTDGRAGVLTGQYDVDGGRTSLQSPEFDLAGANGATAEFWLWYSNNRGAAPYLDVFRLDMSNDGGATWANALTVGPDGLQVEGGWYFYSIRLAAIASLTQNVRLRFVAEDIGVDSVVEAALDDFRLSAVLCNPSPCQSDLNGDGSVGLQDLAIMLAHFGEIDGQLPEDGDLDGDADVDLQDLAILLATFGFDC